MTIKLHHGPEIARDHILRRLDAADVYVTAYDAAYDAACAARDAAFPLDKSPLMW